MCYILTSSFSFSDRRDDALDRKRSVSGRDCQTRQLLDNDVRYYYCQTDTRDWDYCCRPGSKCGYSRNSEFPWCYVGDRDIDQWRPCDVSMVDEPERGRLDSLTSESSRIFTYDFDPDESKRAPDLDHTSLYNRLLNEDRFRDRFRDETVAASNVSTTAIKFGFDD